LTHPTVLRVEQQAADKDPLASGRPGEPDDIAKVVLFYASEASSYVTGTILIVDRVYLLS
jgi:NAD(P)-dependent dehydrogenase (short-subunit alcohol dehydrogenase family)